MAIGSNKVVLISGATKGIGRETAERLAAKGYRVFGTGRNPGNSSGSDGVELLALDVRDDGSVQNCVREVRDRAGRIDVLVNNAGYALTGPAEETSTAEALAQFETNYFGLVRLTNAVLPVMREQKSGLIVNVSSLVGFAAIPFMAHYSASKFAVEGYSEALYQEVLPFGIRVCMIQPGVVSTELYGASGSRTQGAIDAYAPWEAEAKASMDARIKGAIAPGKVTDAVVRAVASRNPALRIPVGPDARLVSRLKRFVPPETFKKIWRKQMGLGIPG